VDLAWGVLSWGVLSNSLKVKIKNKTVKLENKAFAICEGR